MPPQAARAAKVSAHESLLTQGPMSDYFALLQQPRRPWLAPEVLRQQFLLLSAQAHPDRVHTADETTRKSAQAHYAELNAAYQCLADPKCRLRHLIELQRGTPPANLQTVPDGLMELSMEISQLCRQADHFLAEKDAVNSPLLLLKFFEQGQDLSDKLNAAQQRLNAMAEDLNSKLKNLDSQWDSAGSDLPREQALKQVEEFAAVYGYASRWAAQLQERVLRLMI